MEWERHQKASAGQTPLCSRVLSSAALHVSPQDKEGIKV